MPNWRLVANKKCVQLVKPLKILKIIMQQKHNITHSRKMFELLYFVTPSLRRVSLYIIDLCSRVTMEYTEAMRAGRGSISQNEYKDAAASDHQNKTFLTLVAPYVTASTS